MTTRESYITGSGNANHHDFHCLSDAKFSLSLRTFLRKKFLRDEDTLTHLKMRDQRLDHRPELGIRERIVFPNCGYYGEVTKVNLALDIMDEDHLEKVPP